MAPKWFTNKSFKLSLPRLLHRHQTDMASPRDDHTVHKLHQTFRYLDGNGDGKISSDELRVLFTSMGDNMSDDQVKGVISDHDSDRDDLLDFGDFVRLVDNEGGEEDLILRRAFELFEVEKGSGFITPRGLQRMLNRLGDDKSHEECEAMIRTFDLDGNGVVDFDEFRQMMT
ncbi:putative calcium-binding protein CML41 [Cinnamomum micranthum f. kanehirae]|uniref:Putative calcium-binding protein CML41 n=1 Tax=Cinnamomum micranthum f. kanehirae TaxID=337451 RepID=A0A443PY28_9MAGN|nr:putative calcium-binding protein CML41 [Cinnamomum micranthum f. kanehirae]